MEKTDQDRPAGELACTSLYHLLDAHGGQTFGPSHERIATVDEVVRGHANVLAEFSRYPGRWILWIEFDRALFGDHDEKSGRYVQFAFFEDAVSVIGECADNRFLGESCKLDEGQLDALAALGWKEADEFHTPNWHFEATTGDALVTLVQMTGKTLLEVFGLDLRDPCVIRFQERILGSDAA